MKYFFALLWMSLTVFSSCTFAQQNQMNAGEFEKAISKNGIQLLDVRTPREYSEGHISHAMLADWTNQPEFKERVAALDKSKPVYTYCLSGGRSAAAQAWLLSNGFKEVYNLQGGINSWKQNGKKTEGATAGPQLSVADYQKMIPAEKTTLVDVSAVWCPPCRKMEPIVDSLAKSPKRNFEVVKIDGGKNSVLAGHLKVSAFPTFIVYKNGKEVWRHEGLISYEELLSQLKK